MTPLDPRLKAVIEALDEFGGCEMAGGAPAFCCAWNNKPLCNECGLLASRMMREMDAALRAPAVTGEGEAGDTRCDIYEQLGERHYRRCTLPRGHEGDCDLPSAPPAAGAPPADELSASEALFAFGGWLTVRDEPLTLSARHDAAPMVERIGEFCKAYGLAPPRDGWDQKVRKMPGGFTLGSPAPAPVAPPAGARPVQPEPNLMKALSHLFAPPAVAGGDAPEIQVGDEVYYQSNTGLRLHNQQAVDNAHDSDDPIMRVERHGVVIWRRRQEGQ